MLIFACHCVASVLQLCGLRGHMMTNFQFCLLISEALVPILLQDS